MSQLYQAMDELVDTLRTLAPTEVDLLPMPTPEGVTARRIRITPAEETRELVSRARIAVTYRFHVVILAPIELSPGPNDDQVRDEFDFKESLQTTLERYTSSVMKITVTPAAPIYDPTALASGLWLTKLDVDVRMQKEGA